MLVRLRTGFGLARAPNVGLRHWHRARAVVTENFRGVDNGRVEGDQVDAVNVSGSLIRVGGCNRHRRIFDEGQFVPATVSLDDRRQAAHQRIVAHDIICPLPGRFEELAECRIAVTGEVVLGENKFVRQWLKTFYEARVIQRFAENMTALKVADMRYGPALSPRVIEHTATVFTLGSTPLMK